jgi:hypothetical protein
MGFPKLLFDNRLADAIPVASSTSAGNFAAANVADARPYTWHKPSAMPCTNRVDCGSAKAADYALVYGHDLFTKGTTFEVRGSTDNFTTSNVLIATKTPTSNAPFLLEFNSASYRYWGYALTGATAPSIAIAMIGAALVMPRYLNAGFDPIGESAVQQSNQNENGFPLGKIITSNLYKEKINLQNVQWSWLRATFNPAWESNLKASPFVLAWDSVGYPSELQLVVSGGSFTASHKPGGLADLNFDISGVAS